MSTEQQGRHAKQGASESSSSRAAARTRERATAQASSRRIGWEEQQRSTKHVVSEQQESNRHGARNEKSKQRSNSKDNTRERPSLFVKQERDVSKDSSSNEERRTPAAPARATAARRKANSDCESKRAGTSEYSAASQGMKDSPCARPCRSRPPASS